MLSSCWRGMEALAQRRRESSGWGLGVEGPLTSLSPSVCASVPPCSQATGGQLPGGCGRPGDCLGAGRGVAVRALAWTRDPWGVRKGASQAAAEAARIYRDDCESRAARSCGVSGSLAVG